MKRNYIGIIKILIVFCSILVSSSVVNALNSTYSLTDSQQMYVSGSDLVSVAPPAPSQFAYSLLIEDFESGTNTVVRPLEPDNGNYHWLWYDSLNSFGSTTVSNVDSFAGDFSLQSTTNGSQYVAPTYYNNRTSGANDWNYLKEVVSGWQTNKINRMRIWVKLPAEYAYGYSDVGQYSHTNFHVGTYLRDSITSRLTGESETDLGPAGAHFYHYFNIGYEGDTWHQIIVDTHPSHVRQAGGGVEQPNITIPFPDIDPTLNYFDTMTWWYVETKLDVPIGSSFYIDSVELYEEPYDEDVEHIYNLNAAHNPNTGYINVGWSRNKNISNKTVSLKFAFSSFHENGGYDSHGSNISDCQNVMPNAPDFTPNGYNNQRCYTLLPGLTGRDFVYIALKHEDEVSRFREIRIPLTVNGHPTSGGSN